MKIEKVAAAAGALLVFSLVTQCSTQAKGDKPEVTAANPAAAMPATDRISMAEFQKLLANNDVVAIDVRSTEAYLAGHIPGALSMPEEDLRPAAAAKLKSLGKPVATYCS